MTSINNNVPFHDPYDSSPLHPTFFNMTNPTLADLSHTNSNNNVNVDLYCNGPNVNVPCAAPILEDQKFGHNFELGSTSNMEANQNLPPNNASNFGSLDYNNVAPLSYWPEIPHPFFCSCCQVLREIVHTNGFTFEKLEIHGKIGKITHAIHHQNIVEGGSSSEIQYKMIDFFHQSNEDVKKFIIQYCEEHDKRKFVMVEDPFLANFYEAVCIRMEWIEDLCDEMAELNRANDPESEVENGPSNGGSRNLAQQRERAGKMKLSDFSKYFHLPIEEASRKVNLCPTVVKKICRRTGLDRWPYRKVKCIAKQMVVLLNASEVKQDLRSMASTQTEIRRLEKEMVRHCGGVAPTGLDIYELAAT